jgi:outer membrane receptor protein involved in Fe transport
LLRGGLVRSIRLLPLALGLLGAPAAAQPTAPPTATPPTATPATPDQPERLAPAAAADAPRVSVSGRVINALGRPVRGATVVVEGTDVATKTDPDGRYRLAGIAVGTTLVIDARGYQTGLANVNAAGVLDEVVLLTEQQSTEVIEVRSEGPPAAPGAANLDRAELQRIPGTGNDLVRTLTAMPGVVNLQLPIGYSGVVIRGSSPQDSKILIDDFEVPLLYHAIGFRSVIPTEAIDKLDYVPGGFDVAYGRAASGIVALTSRPGSDEHHEQAELSVIDGSLLVQGRIDSKTRYLVGVRRSTIDLLLPYVIPASADLSLTTVPRYYDGQVRIDHTVNDKWKLRLSSLGTDDVLELYTDKAGNADKRFFSETRFLRVTGAASYHDGPWTANLAISGLAQQATFERGIHQFLDIHLPNVATRAELAHTAPDLAGLTDTLWRVGAETTVGHAHINLALPLERREGQPRTGPPDPNKVDTRFDGYVWIPDAAVWTALQANLDPRIRVTTGLRVDLFGRIKDYAIQPRGELQLKLQPELTARLSVGAYVRPPEFQSELLADTVKPERATQMIAGLQYQPREGVRVQTSLYYTDRTDLLTYGADGRSLSNLGRGKTYGAELLATVRQGPWFGFLTYSYSHSARVDSPGGAERLFDYDQPHSLNAALSWKTKTWQLGGRWQLYSGLPNTPILGAVFDSDANSYTAIPGRVNSDRAPMHHQLDLRVDRYFKLGGAAMSAFLDVQNVYLNDSIVGYLYNYDFTQRAAFKSLPIIPSLGIRGEL